LLRQVLSHDNHWSVKLCAAEAHAFPVHDALGVLLVWFEAPGLDLQQGETSIVFDGQSHMSKLRNLSVVMALDNVVFRTNSVTVKV
jgi:hypothetical protein